MIKAKVEREIERINKFERMWKIKMSEEKFKIIPIAQHKTYRIVVNEKERETSKTGKLLGLNISATGFVGRIIKTIKKGNGILTQIRFGKLSAKMKTTLIKTLLIPTMEYPLISVCMASSHTKKENADSIK